MTIVKMKGVPLSQDLYSYIVDKFPEEDLFLKEMVNQSEN